ncbi:family 10 glycosylhydrolase [Paenibacillus sp. GCM10023252]|uniref:family 10 glycosylhydrolase n=1 Tax=Paenibacillus sp. GCM10023252 TaxID=3252649 RepID=UPI00361142AB
MFGSLSVRSLRKSISMTTALIVTLGTFTSSFGSASLSAHAEAAVQSPAVVEGFESLAQLSPSSVRANSVKLDPFSRPEPVLYGYGAGKLSYDFTGTVGTSAAYINFKDPDGTAGRSIPGNPVKLGIWVYGDAGNHWLRAAVRDSAGRVSTLDITASNGLNWSGWRYVTATIPSTVAYPVRLTQLYVVETKDTNKNSGVLYFDQLSAMYADTSIAALDIAGLTPLQAGASGKASVFQTSSGSTEPVQLTSGVTFHSSDEQVAAIGQDGMVQALSPGSAVITADYAGAPQASYLLNVTAEKPLPAKLELTVPGKLEAGTGSKVKVYATYAGLTEPVAVLQGAVFTSSNSAAASIDAAGVVKAIAAGTSTITVTYEGTQVAHLLTVTDPVPVLQRIDLLGLNSLTIGDSLKPRVTGTYTWLNEPVELNSGVQFSSSNPAAASVAADGTVTANAVGATRITAAYGGKSSSYYLTVNKQQEAPKREMRAAWIATVDHVDWPARGVVTEAEQKASFTAMLDKLESAGINALIVQVKPTSDAFYPSQYGPWSEWLTGVQGKDPGYDPLAFMLEEAHKRNMEFHAWFNPYRISLQDDVNKLVADHPARLHPDWVVSYGGKLYYNPGIPAARAFIQDSIMEVVNGYDIDAVHFDDYFYPYPVTGVDFPDDAQYQQYGAGSASKGDWRRDNVNQFVQEISVKIKQAKSYVKFGISPFGIWKNKSTDPAGSDTNGLSSYDAIYADSKKWIDEQWIDYVTPQIYWYLGYSPAAYDKLTEWWSGLVEGKNVQLYSGHALYRIGTGEDWMDSEEMPDQIKYNRNFDNVQGSMFFSAKGFADNPLGFTDRLSNDLYRYPALVPAMPWLDSTAPTAPAAESAVGRGADGVQLKWKEASGSDTSYYVVYRYEGTSAGDLDDPSHMVGKVRRAAGSAEQTYTDVSAVDGMTYTYVITAVDRLHNESAASSGLTLMNTLDVTAPNTTAAVTGDKQGDWYASKVSVVLNASDDLSGVAATETSKDGGASWQRVQIGETVTIASEGRSTLLYRSVDEAGNVEESKSLSVAIDVTAPVVTITGAGVYKVDQTVRMTCTAADSVSGLASQTCDRPIVEAPAYELGLGRRMVSASATDAAGHISTATAEYEVVVTASSLAVLTKRFVTGAGAGSISDSLVKKLEQQKYDDYIAGVRAQSGKRLTVKQAEMLASFAAALKAN